MTAKDVARAGLSIAQGRRPILSIEITRECPLRCPGCYAYEDGHVGEGLNLRQLSDLKGSELIDGVLELTDRHRPLMLYIVGGDPLVRHRELDALLPELSRRDIPVQLVTSAFRRVPPAWTDLPRVRVTVSIDGLQPDHDERRKPATYARILDSIRGSRVTIHCTVTGRMADRPGYLEEFLRFWTPRPEIAAVRVSLFTPQVGDDSAECLTTAQRDGVVDDLLRLRKSFPKLNMGGRLIRAFAHPPASPEECLFAQTTETISADLKTRITPCQFGGEPDCSRCGCMASVGFAAVGRHKVGGVVPIWKLFQAARGSGRAVAKVRAWAGGVNGAG